METLYKCLISTEMPCVPFAYIKDTMRSFRSSEKITSLGVWLISLRPSIQVVCQQIGHQFVAKSHRPF